MVKGPSGSSRWLRITLASVRPGHTPADEIALGVGLKVAVGGITYQPALRLPSDETSAFSHPGSKTVDYSFNAPLANGNLDLNTPSDDDPQMIRRFTVPRTTTVHITGAVTPVPGPALDPLLPKVVSDVSVSASSTLQDLPRFGPDNLLSDSGRPWIADLGDKAPSLTFTWARRPFRELDRVEDHVSGVDGASGRDQRVVRASRHGQRAKRRRGHLVSAPVHEQVGHHVREGDRHIQRIPGLRRAIHYSRRGAESDHSGPRERPGQRPSEHSDLAAVWQGPGLETRWFDDLCGPRCRGRWGRRTP